MEILRRANRVRRADWPKIRRFFNGLRRCASVPRPAFDTLPGTDLKVGGWAPGVASPSENAVPSGSGVVRRRVRPCRRVLTGRRTDTAAPISPPPGWFAALLVGARRGPLPARGPRWGSGPCPSPAFRLAAPANAGRRSGDSWRWPRRGTSPFVGPRTRPAGWRGCERLRRGTRGSARHFGSAGVGVRWSGAESGVSVPLPGGQTHDLGSPEIVGVVQYRAMAPKSSSTNQSPSPGSNRTKPFAASRISSRRKVRSVTLP